MRRKSMLLALGLMALMGVSWAQIATGTPPFGSFGGGPFDVVNLGNLNVHFSVPIRHKAGRGVPFSYDLAYDNSIWQIVTSNGNKSWQPVRMAGSFGSYWGWQGLGPTYAPYVSYLVTFTMGNCFNGTLQTYQQWSFSNFVYHDKDNVAHSFGTNGQYFISPGGNSCPPNGQVPSTIPSASDQSGYTLSNVILGGGSASGKLTDIQGTAFSVAWLTTPPTSPSPFTVTDRNGNTITQTNGIYTDTLGTTVLTAAGVAPSNTTYTYKSPTNANVSYTVSYVPYTVQTAFNCTNPTIADYPATANVYLVDKITQPDQAFYKFTYEPTTMGSQNVTGRVAQVTLPTGGTISYSYGPINCADGSAQALTRTLDGGTWNYARSGSPLTTTTITDPTPTHNQTVINFVTIGSNVYETQRQTYTGTATLLSTIITCYNQTSPSTSCTAPGGSVGDRTVLTYLPDSTGVLAATYTTYYQNTTIAAEVDSYDYGTKGSGSWGPLIRKVVSTYNVFGSATLPTNIKIEDVNNAVKASTTFTYDQTAVTATTGTPNHVAVTGARGNLTSIATQVSGTVTLYRRFTYYDTGTMKTSSDAGTTSSGGANLASYNYNNTGTPSPSCGNSFATSVMQPLSLSRSFTWNCDGGVVTSVTDENGKTATTFYTGTGADPFYWRPYQMQDQMIPANTTTFSYPSVTVSEGSMLFNGNNSVVDDRSKSDTYGRVIVNEILQAPSGSTYDSVETDYDVAGRIAKITRPYSAATDSLCSGTCPGTTIGYDGLSRSQTVIDGGTGTLNNTYTYNDVLRVVGPPPTGEHSKQRQLEFNGLGWLTSVCEITAVSGSGSCGQNNPQTGFLTKYTYDLLGNRTGVTQNTQPGSIGQQTRTYVFDMLGRLTSELNPETGTTAITYVFDSWDAACGTYTSAGDLVEKKDAMGNVTCLKYDALHRNTQITYPSGNYHTATPTKCFVYDSATVNGIVMSNVSTRLAEAYTSSAASCPGTKTVDEGFSYSARGEITDVWESTPNSGGYYHVNATYWANGNLNVLNGGTNPLPGLSAITYALNSEGLPSTVSAGTGQNPVTATSYNVAHQATGVTFGSADSDAFQFDPNTGRMTQYKFNMGTGPQTDIGVLTWNTNGTLKQLQITDQINSANTHTCGYIYDDLARITSANCGSVWAQTFGLDPFGNLTKTGSAQFLPTYNLAKNQYSSIPGGSVAYDLNGNLTNDVTHSYTWDADGNNLSVDGTTVGMIYDAFDRMIEQTRGSARTQIVYGPNGMKLALMNAQTLINAFVKLPGGASAVYGSSGLAYYRHSDHLGSSRLATTPSRTKQYDVSYGPYGEDYNGSGTQDLAFTDQNQDTVKNGWSTNLYDFMFREYRTAHGRWTSPDPAGLAAVNPANPQSWNRYAYALNSPTWLVDPLGLVQHCVINTIYFYTNAVDKSADKVGFASHYAGSSTWILCYDVPDSLLNATIPSGGQTGGGSPANKGQPQQTARQKCLSQGYNTPEGKAVQFLSPVSLTPLNPNWKENWGEWGIAVFGKGGGMFGTGIGFDTGIQTLNGLRNVGSWLENTTNSVLRVGEEVGPYAMAGMTLADVLLQAQCAVDPSAPLEGIPVGPK